MNDVVWLGRETNYRTVATRDSSPMPLVCGEAKQILQPLGGWDSPESPPTVESFFERSAEMNERELRLQLQKEGFGHTYIRQDGPNASYPDHTHDTEAAHIILSGEMTLRMNGSAATYRAGERCDVPAGTVHSAKMGPEGCRYLIGER